MIFKRFYKSFQNANIMLLKLLGKEINEETSVAPAH